MVKNLPANAGDITDVDSIPVLGRLPRGGHDNPLQHSCLENPMDREAWWAIVHRVTKSQTQLKLLNSHTSSKPTSCCSFTQLCPTLHPHRLQQARLLCPSLSPGVCSNSCPLSQCCHPTISSRPSPPAFNHLCHALLLLPSTFPSIRVFSNELAFHIRWPKYWSSSMFFQ